MFKNDISQVGVGTSRRGSVRSGLRVVTTGALRAICVVALLAAAGGVAHADDPGPAPSPSAGCGRPVPARGETTVQLRGTEKTGRYRQHVPAGADRPLPVVIALHGLLENIDIADAGSGFGEYGYREGFITITPSSIGWVSRSGSTVSVPPT